MKKVFFFTLALAVILCLGCALSQAETLATLRRKAEEGNIQAILELGEIYRDGERTARNIEKALKYYGDAAVRGNAEGM